MRALIALVWHEIRERRALIAAAAVASVLPLLAPVLSGAGSNPPEDIREAAMWVMVFGLVPLFALLLGVSFIGRDLSEGRLGFYYAQPLSGPVIWLGKLTAVALLLWTAQIVIMLPTVLLAPEELHLIAPKGFLGPYDPLWLTVLPLWLGPILVLLLAHAVGTLWRSRSAWLIVDLLAFLVVMAGAWAFIWPFLLRYTSGVAEVGVLSLIATLFLGLLVGGLVQLTMGRVDPGRGHRALSMTLWAVLVFGVAALGGWTWWVRAATPGDLSTSHQVAVGGGDWIAVRGNSPGRVDFKPRFVMNVSDGRWLRANSSELWDMRDVVFSRDESRVIWLSPIAFGSSKLMVADLDQRQPEGRESGLEFDVYVRGLALSDDGRRLAVIQGHTVEVFDIDRRAQLAAARIEGEFEPHSLAFEDPNMVRVESIRSPRNRGERRQYQTHHLDIAEKRLSDGDEPRIHFHLKTLPRDDGVSLVSIIGLSEDEQRLILVDEITGERVAELGRMPSWSNVRVVGDYLVVVRIKDMISSIEVFDGWGRSIHRIELGTFGAVFDGGEISPGRIVVGLWNWTSEARSGRLLESAVVDVRMGEVTRVLDGYAPVLGPWGPSTSPGAWATGAVASRLVSGEDHSLHLWRPETNELEQLIPVPN